MTKTIHTIPVGGEEPMHTANASCWCHPLVTENGTVTHHARDGREARERFGRNLPDERWVLVNQDLAELDRLRIENSNRKDQLAVLAGDLAELAHYCGRLEYQCISAQLSTAGKEAALDTISKIINGDKKK